jgi:hypothetical protein
MNTIARGRLHSIPVIFIVLRKVIMVITVIANTRATEYPQLCGLEAGDSGNWPNQARKDRIHLGMLLYL